MASVIEERNAIIQKYIPKLITNLTGLSSNENYKLCLQFAWSHTKYHRYLSVNSHEVKRDIEGICEKLKLNNFHPEEKEFRKIVVECLTSELAVNHYEKDVMYSIINLLTTLAYDPINKLKDKKRRGIPVFQRIKTFEINDKKTTDCHSVINSLLKDNFKIVKHNETDSELSEWTESDDDESHKSNESEAEIQSTKPSPTSTFSLKPPQKPNVFKNFSIERDDNEKWLRENIQNSWWNSNEITYCEKNSNHPVANFCLDWQRHLTKRSLGFIKPQPTSLISEYCLLREILWMFSNPTDCKFFKFNNNEISLRKNVSLPSTVSQTLQIFLKDLTKSMNILHALRTEIQKSLRNSALCHTFENYFGMIQNIVDEIMEFIVEQEECVKKKDEIYTIITLHNKFRIHAKMLSMLWDIHRSSILDEEKYPAHICASYLLANLNYHVHNSTSIEKKNLSLALLCSCLKPYLKIFEIWWTEGRLHDLKMEFLVEKVFTEESEFIQRRLFEKCKEKSFYINDSVTNRISHDSIMSTMNYFTMEASATLETISKLDRVHEMKNIRNSTSKTFYDEFFERISDEIKALASNTIVEDELEMDHQKVEVISNNQKLIDDIKNGIIDEGDEMMLLIFKSTFRNFTPVEKKVETSPLKIYKMLNKATDSIFMPLENSIQRIIEELLAKKISIAERFVMEIYLNELSIEHCLQDIRKVFFLESNELMNYFNIKLFPKMESGDDSTWANSYHLTVTLNEAICSGRETLFNVTVNKKHGNRSVLDSIDQIEIDININPIFENIFTSNYIMKYNEIFRFLLKIKYGQKILNDLKFPEFFKNRKPYAKLTMLDLVIKRLALTRFSMQQAINTIHNHLMVILQGISNQFDFNVSKMERINDLIGHHKRFVELFYRKAFLNDECKRTRGIIIEMLKLAKIIKDEWHNIAMYHELDSAGKIDDSLSLAKLNVNTIETEKAFKACENQLKDLLYY